MHGRDETCGQHFVKPEGSGPLGRRRCMWEDNIKMDLGCEMWTGFIWPSIGSNG
jgi:hypothetical protein